VSLLLRCQVSQVYCYPSKGPFPAFVVRSQKWTVPLPAPMPVTALVVVEPMGYCRYAEEGGRRAVVTPVDMLDASTGSTLVTPLRIGECAPPS